jgi:ribose-phosphate pyrophosphokinase
MIDTGGTLAADLMMERGIKRKSYLYACHIIRRLRKNKNSKLLELIVTDSIPLKKKSNKIRVVSCAPLFAEVMHMVHHNNSISGKFNVTRRLKPRSKDFLLKKSLKHCA